MPWVVSVAENASGSAASRAYHGPAGGAPPRIVSIADVSLSCCDGDFCENREKFAVDIFPFAVGIFPFASQR
jgi:hypothetical protein